MRAAEEARGDVLGRAALLPEREAAPRGHLRAGGAPICARLATSPIPCIVTKSEEHRFNVLPGHMVV